MELAAGLSSCVAIVVGADDTAAAVGSGDVPALATPRLLALAEAAAVAAIAPALKPGLTSVGTSALIEHTKASPIGVTVSAEAELTRVEGRRLGFRFRAWHVRPGAADDDREIVAEGTMERVLVDRERFLSRVQPAPRPES